jgi:hypothetical protein
VYAGYDVSRGLRATLPNHGTLIFSGDLAQDTQASKTPGPGDYINTDTRPLGSQPLSIGKAPRADCFPAKDTPGPSDYDVRPHIGSGGPSHSFAANQDYEPSSSGLSKAGLDPMVGFGYACKFVEHVCYGACLDRRCSQRGRWEVSARRALAGDPRARRARRRLREELLDKQSVLHMAARRGEHETVGRILLDGFDPDALDDCGRTALHYAAELGHYRMVRRIVYNDRHPYVTKKGYRHERRAPLLDVQDDSGDTPLHLAARSGSAAVLELLYRAGARHDVRNRAGSTPLDVCASDSLYSKAKYMLEIDLVRAELRDVQGEIERRKQCAEREVGADPLSKGAGRAEG